MEDISPKLLKAITESYDREVSNNTELTDLLIKISNGKGSYEDAHKYSQLLGECLKNAFKSNVSEETLPNGRMYYNIAKSLLEPSLKTNYDDISERCVSVQTILNSKANINLKAVKPGLNADKINGIIDYVSSAEKYSTREKSFLNTLENFSESVVDDSVKENAELHYSCGLSPKIKRIAHSGACKWCQSLTGTYNYEDVRDTGNSVFRRHGNCKCLTMYDPGDGSKRVQDVWGKKWKSKSRFEAVSQRLAKVEDNEDSSVWPKTGKRITKKEYKEFRNKVLDLGYKISGFKGFEGDTELVIECLKKTQSVKEKYPELFEGSMQVILSQSKSSILIDDDTFAITYNGHEITLNGNAFISKEILKKEYKKLADEGWFVKETDYKSIIIHELGHVASSRYNINGLEIAMNVTGLSKDDVLEYLKNNLSVYSGSYRNGQEIIAEVFSDYFNNKNTSDFSLKFINEIDKIILKERSK